MTPRSATGKGEVKWDSARDADVLGNDSLTAGQREFRSGEALDSLQPRFQTSGGSALERKLLLEASPETSRALKRPRPFRFGRWLIASTALTLITGAAGVALFQDGKRLQDRVAGVSADLRAAEAKAVLLEATVNRNNAENERLLAESKTETRGLALLAEKSMEELKRSLGDFRQLQQDKDKLESQYRKMLSRRQSLLGTVLAAWLPRWLGKERNTE
jgi:hypothetical protein